MLYIHTLAQINFKIKQLHISLTTPLYFICNQTPGIGSIKIKVFQKSNFLLINKVIDMIIIKFYLEISIKKLLLLIHIVFKESIASTNLCTSPSLVSNFALSVSCTSAGTLIL